MSTSIYVPEMCATVNVNEGFHSCTTNFHFATLQIPLHSYIITFCYYSNGEIHSLSTEFKSISHRLRTFV